MFLRLTSSTLALTALAAPGLALTPEEVWTAWTTEYGRMGYTITEGARDLAGEVLTLTDVAFVQQGEDEGERVTVTAPRIVLTGTGDGNVRTTLDDALALEVVTRDDEDRPLTVTGTLQAPGLEVLSTGDAETRTDAVTAPNVVATLDRIDRVEGDDILDVARLTLADLTATAVSQSGGRSLTSTSRVGTLDYTLDYADAEGSIAAKGNIANIESSGRIDAPQDAAVDFAEQMSAALKAGALLDGTLKLGAGSHDFAFTGTSEGETESGTLEIGIGGTEVSFRIAQDGLAYQGAMTDLDVGLTGGGLPAPMAYALGEATFDIQGPVIASETPSPFKFAYALGGLTLDDQVWAMADPSGQLPRDPASIDIDLTGQMRLTADLFDPAWREAAVAADAAEDSPGDAGAAPAPAEGTIGPEAIRPDPGAAPDADAAADAAAPPMPVEVTEVVINQVAIDAAGVKAEASGRLAAPEGGDISEPIGTISARYEGVNRLIDALVTMGVISQEEVMGYRMMLTLFARPSGEGEDVLTTELEFGEGGAIIANGQKIK